MNYNTTPLLHRVLVMEVKVNFSWHRNINDTFGDKFKVANGLLNGIDMAVFTIFSIWQSQPSLTTPFNKFKTYKTPPPHINDCESSSNLYWYSLEIFLLYIHCSDFFLFLPWRNMSLLRVVVVCFQNELCKIL